jgi:hypothetical protein
MRKTGVLAYLPEELHYLISPALKYGIHQTDDQRSKFLNRANSDELDELAAVAERYRLNDHGDLVADFFDAYPITDYPESAKLYWLFGIMGDAGFALSPENWHSVERYVKRLKKYGSFRLASERMFAAKLLADFGESARLAIPDLRRALSDEDLRVQIWAHYALAVIEGNIAEHERAVREIYSQHDEKDELDCHKDDVGGEAAEALEKFHEMRLKR